MKVDDSVRLSLSDWSREEHESAVLHACNAVDGTARKEFPTLGSKARFTRLLRENYTILGAMTAPGINLQKTRFPVSVRGPTTEDGYPDLADVVWGIHRCAHGHGDELPAGFRLMPDAARSSRRTQIHVAEGTVRLSDRLVFGLLVVAVTAPVNSDCRVPETNFLSLDRKKYLVNDLWGQREMFKTIVDGKKRPSVTLDFGHWMENLQ